MANISAAHLPAKAQHNIVQTIILLLQISNSTWTDQTKSWLSFSIQLAAYNCHHEENILDLIYLIFLT